MFRIICSLVVAIALVACGGAQKTEIGGGREAADSEPGVAGEDSEDSESAPGKNRFQIRDSNDAKDARGVEPSKIKPTETEAAIKFFVVDRNRDEAPIEGIVISLAAPDGRKFYTEETDAKGYAEVLVPVGQKYDIVYLSLGRRDINASVKVDDVPNLTLRLTLRYKRYVPPPRPEAPGFVLKGITFDTGRATVKPESFERLDGVVEYMTHKRSARIEISGHTDNVGNAQQNKTLSEDRANACRDYLISKGIDDRRIDAVGYGDERPIASNNTREGREQNRRIEATELP
ncbi:MAG: OmpA family protein [Proteobacteria bacterium]|nr:OmpA family protein [Pseudomonadota bacterium]